MVTAKTIFYQPTKENDKISNNKFLEVGKINFCSQPDIGLPNKQNKTLKIYEDMNGLYGEHQNGTGYKIFSSS